MGLSIDVDGNRRWYNLEGQLHRGNGPAVEYVNGDKFWYIEDQFHRLDGSAVEFRNGGKFWYVKGYYYTEEEFNLEIKKLS